MLEGQETPTGNTVYGTPRTFSATIVQLGTGGAIQGDLTFFAGATPICTTELNPTSLASATVRIPCFILHSFLEQSPVQSPCGVP